MKSPDSLIFEGNFGITNQLTILWNYFFLFYEYNEVQWKNEILTLSKYIQHIIFSIVALILSYVNKQ